MIFLAIFSGAEFKLEKAGPTFSRFNPWTSLPSVATDDRKQFLYLNIDFNIKTGPLFLEFNWCTNNYIHIYVVVNFFISDNFVFLFFLGMVMLLMKLKQRKKTKITWDKKNNYNLHRAIFVWPWKMVSGSVRYLFYQPMDEKIKTGTLRFPAKENPNMEKVLLDWPFVLQHDVKAKYRLISRKFSGMTFFHLSVRLTIITNQKPRAFASVR